MTKFRYYSDEELVREVAFIGDPLVEELADRLSGLQERSEKDRAAEEARMVSWAVSCLLEHAGEDFHTYVIDLLNNATTLKKADMVEVIKEVVDLLRDMDSEAGRMVEAMANDGAM